MLKKIINRENLLNIAKELSHKRFKPGFDGMSMDGAYSWVYINGDRLCRDILTGAYRPMPASGFHMAKASGGIRRLARFTALDTILQKALVAALTPIAEGKFSDRSYAYRADRGVPSALKQYVELAGQYRFVARIDLCSCYDNIDHEILHGCTLDFFTDVMLSDLLTLFAKTPVHMDGEISANEKGLLQGMPLAPLLCNIYLHRADTFFESKNIPFLRYADDIVLFGNSITEMTQQVTEASHFFEDQLKLRLNRKKTRIDTATGIVFLGHKFSADKKGIIALDANADVVGAYHNWHSNKKRNPHGRWDLVSDGILRQKDFSLLFDTETTDTSIPVTETNTINIYSDVVLDSGFLTTAMKNGICINIFDKKGARIGSIEPTMPLKAPKVTHEQLCAYYDERRIGIAREFLLASVHNTLLNIRYYNKHSPEKEFDSAINKLNAMRTVLRNAETMESLMIAEARCREIYYSCFDHFVKKEGFSFDKRTRRPPENEINALLSFGNTVLYNLIASEIEKTPLDIRIGFLHATNTRYASLNLDLAEIFKPLIVDRVVFSLINKGELSPSMFTKWENGGVYLNQDAKRLFLQAFYEKLETVITHKDRKMTYDRVITEEIGKLVRSFRNKEPYKAFRQVR